MECLRPGLVVVVAAILEYYAVDTFVPGLAECTELRQYFLPERPDPFPFSVP